MDATGKGSMKIDRKFIFTAVNPCNGRHYTEENAVVFCAKDQALVPALQAYKTECARIGADIAHLESIAMMIDRVKDYQRNVHCKVPDIGECEVDRCIGGIGLQSR